ncbi:hypothetical protein COV05_01360 [Candidatus Uhrbacteria bacterium CG10_big_fil_rev_8_21_14_0_10_48_16]|uniref:Uncharacterized protein n=1 Tax=Candidatus Uhrbacteria bacterium CG10_big_fil_rev_8_21_14_0_10_48_16 TaxID=1975038 RepID=A0A2M8LHX4_9BACT|nr:MAG: hypothetical protein COV05_01360 [Candidatus Uhrbacteria bacterium CG10_big_fil_rev_8_21_14_0_10_48_16]
MTPNSSILYIFPSFFLLMLVLALVYVLKKRVRIRAWIKSLESRGYQRLPLPRPYTHWYATREDAPTYFIVIEKVRTYTTNDRAVPDLGLAIYIPLSTSLTPTDIIYRCMQTTSICTRTIFRLQNFIERIIPQIFKRPSLILASSQRFTVYAPEILPHSLRPNFNKQTLILRIGFSWNHSIEDIQDIYASIQTRLAHTTM